VAQKTYLIVAALMRRGEEVLLVRQQGANDPAPSWALPGGVVESGELLTEALTREVREETGLEVIDSGHLLYAVHAARDNSAEGHQTLVFVFAVAEWRGELRVADPDNLILGACFWPRAEAIEKLESLPWPTMREPMVAYLRGEAGRGAVWLYRGKPDGADELVARTSGAGR
jgi:8-oxo-dGTP diphosphatase